MECQTLGVKINTWIKKSRNWHIDGVANKSSVWFFMSTNLQKIPVKISRHFDVWSTSYSDLSDASLDILKTMDLKQFRVLIYHCFLMKKHTVQAQKWLKKCYRDSAPSKTTICRCYAEFKRGRTDTKDAERSDRPNEVVTPKTIKKVHQIVFENRKLKLREIADTLKISYGTVYAILHEHFSMSKQSVRSAQSGQKRKCGPVRLWPQYIGMLMEFCSSATLKKIRRSIANVTLANWCVWRTKSVRNGSKWRRKKYSFTNRMRRVTSRSLPWRNGMNWGIEFGGQR